MYKIKKLIDGFKLGMPGKTLIAVPHNKGYIKVEYDGVAISLLGKKPILLSEPLKDKYGRGTTYQLAYYEWTPENKKINVDIKLNRRII